MEMRFPKKRTEYVMMAIVAGTIAGLIMAGLFSSVFDAVATIKISAENALNPLNKPN